MRPVFAVVLLCACMVTACDDDDDFDNPCDPANIAEGNCKDAEVGDAQIVDMAPADARVVDAAPLIDMAPVVDMTPVADQGVVDMAPPDMSPPDMGPPDMSPPDMGPPGCVNPDYNPACADSMDRPSCEANGGAWGQWVFAEPPIESCDCPTRDGGCPCETFADCEISCYVPATVGNDGCTDEPARCWGRTQALGCFCDPMGEDVACP